MMPVPMEGAIFEKNFFCKSWYLAHKKWVLLSKFQNLLFMNRPNVYVYHNFLDNIILDFFYVCYDAIVMASTFAAWIWRGDVQMMRQPVPRVTAKTDTTMMVSFIDQEKMVRCPPWGAVRSGMKRQTTARSLLPTENTHAFLGEGYIYISTKSRDHLSG